MSSRIRQFAALVLLAALTACPERTPNEIAKPRSSPTLCTPAVRLIDIEDHVYDVAFGEGAVWLLVGDDRDYYSIRSVDPNSLSVSAPIPVGPPGTDVFEVTVGGGSVWVPLFGGERAQSAPGLLLRINPKTRRIEKRIKVGRHPLHAAAGGSSVWVSNEMDGTVSVVSPSVGRVTDVIDVGGQPGRITYANGAVWVLTKRNRDTTTVLRIDQSSHDVENVMSRYGIVTIGDGAIWFVDERGIGRYDMVTRREHSARLKSDVEPSGIAVGEGTVWFARVFLERTTPSPGSTPFRDRLPRINGGFWKANPITLERETETIMLPKPDGYPREWAVGLGALWAPAEVNKKLLKVALTC